MILQDVAPFSRFRTLQVVDKTLAHPTVRSRAEWKGGEYLRTVDDLIACGHSWSFFAAGDIRPVVYGLSLPSSTQQRWSWFGSVFCVDASVAISIDEGVLRKKVIGFAVPRVERRWAGN